MLSLTSKLGGQTEEKRGDEENDTRMGNKMNQLKNTVW